MSSRQGKKRLQTSHLEERKEFNVFLPPGGEQGNLYVRPPGGRTVKPSNSALGGEYRQTSPRGNKRRTSHLERNVRENVWKCCARRVLKYFHSSHQGGEGKT